jgi:hypothetical protein
MVLLSVWKASHLADTGDSRLSVERSLTNLLDLQPVAPDDPALAQAMGQLLEAPHVATVWLLSPEGEILVSEGATAASTPPGSQVEELTTGDTEELIAALPDSALSDEQRTWLLAASAIRREGSHNDLYDHLLFPISRQDGSTLAVVGVAYETTGWTAGIGWKMAVLVGVLSLLLYWLLLPLWVFLDGRARGDRAVPWAMFVLVGNLVALLAYLLTRPPDPRPTGDEK